MSYWYQLMTWKRNRDVGIMIGWLSKVSQSLGLLLKVVVVVVIMVEIVVQIIRMGVRSGHCGPSLREKKWKYSISCYVLGMHLHTGVHRKSFAIGNGLWMEFVVLFLLFPVF